MSFALVVCRAALVATLIIGCKNSSNTVPDGSSQTDGSSQADGSSQMCAPGDKECRADGLYTCDASSVFQRTEACTNCEAAPVPHCAVTCADPGVTSICEGDSVHVCATGTTFGCDTGTCLPAGQQAVCATKPGISTCVGRRTDGTQYVLACGDANGVSTTQVCDQRTSQCVAATFDCSALASLPTNRVGCDSSSGNYYSSCVNGQPNALTCTANTTCANDGTTSCYTPEAPGAACGGPTVCYPGLHCTQEAADGASCVRPAGQLACNSSDVLAVCNNIDTAFACFRGAIWTWRNLTSWGGSCTGGAIGHVTLAAGGVCIPGLADCKQGLECHRSKFDIAGICRTPEPNAPAECTLTSQTIVGRSCSYDWHACRDGHYYDIDCRLVGAGGATATLCDCFVDGARTATVGSEVLCNVTDTAMLDAAARQTCGWSVTTTDSTPE